jgi:hypothetical protein
MKTMRKSNGGIQMKQRSAFGSGVAVCVAVAALFVSGPAQASATDCLRYGYACTPGYTGANAAGSWAWTYYGGSYASTPNGCHNCTL